MTPSVDQLLAVGPLQSVVHGDESLGSFWASPGMDVSRVIRQTLLSILGMRGSWLDLIGSNPCPGCKPCKWIAVPDDLDPFRRLQASGFQTLYGNSARGAVEHSRYHAALSLRWKGPCITLQAFWCCKGVVGPVRPRFGWVGWVLGWSVGLVGSVRPLFCDAWKSEPWLCWCPITLSNRGLQGIPALAARRGWEHRVRPAIPLPFNAHHPALHLFTRLCTLTDWNLEGQGISCAPPWDWDPLDCLLLSSAALSAPGSAAQV